MGVSVWGPAPVGHEIRGRIAAELGAEVQQPKTMVPVYGYGPGFGLNACEDGSYAQREVRRAWPSADVKVTDCQHITRMGLRRPSFTLALEGVPRDWEQTILQENDARLRQKVWVTCATQHAKGQRKYVGPGIRLMRGLRLAEDNTGRDLV